jgi:hypothetical protein
VVGVEVVNDDENAIVAVFETGVHVEVWRGVSSIL